MPSPTFWKVWGTSVNGAWPIHCAPSPPIWVRPVTALSVRPETVTSVWQPMPPPPIEPSGRAVERLCGQPLQKYGVRCADSGSMLNGGGSGRRTGVIMPGAWSSITCRSGASIRPVVSSPSTGIRGRPSRSRLPRMRGAPAVP